MSGTTTYFVGGHYEAQGMTVSKYYFAGAQRVAVRKSGTLSYLLTDHLGSISATTNSSGQLVSGQLYKAWGESRYSLGTSPTKYSFTGQYSYTSDFGLMFYNARWYDPATGRFTSADTVVPGAGNSQAWDRYAYTFNNPVRYTDPSGHCPACALLLLLALAGCGVPPSNSQSIESAVNVTVDGAHSSLATKINGNTILTHNHQNSTLDQYSADGISYQNGYSDSYGPVDGVDQTRLVTLDSNIPGDTAPIASQDVISTLSVGDTVNVDYWDDASQSFAKTTLEIWYINPNGTIVLLDPNRIIDNGDSGGGVSINGELIGNTWKTGEAYEDGKYIGPVVTIALLPPSITNSSQAITPILPPPVNQREQEPR